MEIGIDIYDKYKNMLTCNVMCIVKSVNLSLFFCLPEGSGVVELIFLFFGLESPVT